MAVADPSTIAAIATPPGRGALGIVRLSGPQALRIGRAVFHVEQGLQLDGRVRRGRVIGADGQVIDDALAWGLRGPGTYTGEDTVEVSTHGSAALLALLVDAMVRHGARRADPGDFTRRAFLNGRMDLVQAEAVADLIAAQSAGGFHVAYGALSGGLSRRLRDIRELLVDAVAFLEAGLDFSDDVEDAQLGDVLDRVQAAGRGAAGLVASFAGVRQRLQGYRVAIVGQPNAGKSTLLNRWLGEDRALVSDTPGTTRDWLEAAVVWDGEIVHLVDTAGIRSTRDPIEAEGVARSRAQAAAADVVVQIVDAASPDVEMEPAAPGTPMVLALNKTDLPRGRSFPPNVEAQGVEISGLTGAGLEELQRRVVALLPRQGPAEEVGLLRERHRDGLEIVEASTRGAERELRAGRWETAAEELHTGLRALGEVLGEDAGDAVLDRIFSAFCIGK